MNLLLLGLEHLAHHLKPNSSVSSREQIACVTNRLTGCGYRIKESVNAMVELFSSPFSLFSFFYFFFGGVLFKCLFFKAEEKALLSREL